jgi:hypothetical protein
MACSRNEAAQTPHIPVDDEANGYPCLLLVRDRITWLAHQRHLPKPHLVVDID